MMDFLVYAAAYLIGSIPMGRLLKKGKKGSAKQLKFVLDMAKGAAAAPAPRPPVEGQALGVPVPWTELARASTGTGEL